MPNMLESTSMSMSMSMNEAELGPNEVILNRAEASASVLPNAPYIRADLRGIAAGHWGHSADRLEDLVQSLCAEALLCGTPRHCLIQALLGVVEDLEGKKLGAADLSSFVPVLSSLLDLEQTVCKAESGLKTISE